MAKNRSKGSVLAKKKKKLHPLFAMLAGFFVMMLIALGVTAHAYNAQSPIQQVADAHTEAVVATPKTCILVQSVVGTGSCVNNAYASVTVTCGDGTKPVISFGKSTTTKEKSKTTAVCHNLNDWMAQIANACKNHSSCPNPTSIPRPTEKAPSQPVERQNSLQIEQGQTTHTNK